MANLAKHAFGSKTRAQQALSEGKIDQFDILFFDEGEIGWVSRDGEIVYASGRENVVAVDVLPASGEEGVIYIYNDEGYVWSGTEFVTISKPADLSALEAEIATKVSADEVDEKLDRVAIEDVKYEVFSKPAGTLVDYREKEIRIMCPADTQWALQNVGQGGNPDMYYVGLKMYAPSADVTGFKAGWGEVVDDTVYSFENNEFAGVDEYGRKFNIAWVPVAVHDATADTWTYRGAESTDVNMIGWYVSIEWLDAAGTVASDCIRVNLTNEACHTSVEPFCVVEAVKSANEYTDNQIETKIAASMTIVEF